MSDECVLGNVTVDEPNYCIKVTFFELFIIRKAADVQ